MKILQDPKRAINYMKYRTYFYRLRLKGENPESISFYKYLQDRKVEEGQAYPQGEGFGKAQIEFLKRKGLKEEDVFLDIGCGNLRGGRYMIDYLNSSNYHGIDISEEAIHQGKKNIKKWGFTDKQPQLLVNDDLRFLEFTPSKFDWIFANSVLTHLSEQYIRECFANIGRILSKDGVATLSYHHAKNQEKVLTNTITTSNLYRYPFDDLQEWAQEYDLNSEYDDYPEHPRTEMKMIILSNSTPK